ncbi:MAG: MFS transporter, partial [Plesiomonas shigelloides]
VTTKAGIANLMFIYPASALLCAALLMLCFYPLNEQRYQHIIAELAERHLNNRIATTQEDSL